MFGGNAVPGKRVRDANKRVVCASLGHKYGGAFCLIIQEDSTRDIASTMGDQLI